MIFLGAGASVPFGIPTTKTLTTDIKKMLVKEYRELSNDMDIFWQETYEKLPNYENILTCLMGLTNPRRIPRGSVIQAFVKDYKKHKANYDKIVDEMYSRIITYCTAPFVSSKKYISPERLEEIFRYTYDCFALLRREVIFTTNYDPSLEIWCQKRNIQLYDNTKPTKNPEIREILPINEKTIESGETALFLRYEPDEIPALKIVRLHGSTWVYETEKKKRIKMNRPRDKLLFTDLYSHLNKRPHMIFPGQESVLASGEWDVLYQYLRRMLKGNCLVIGYSFQDETINRAFIDNLNKNQLRTIGILSPHPNEAVKNLFWDQEIPYEKIVQIPVEFGTENAIFQIQAKWVNKVLRIPSYGSGVNTFLHNFRKKAESYLD